MNYPPPAQMVQPRISIVMPSYNQAHFIGEAIDSVLIQNYPNTELIVVDGGSTDSTCDVLRKYGDKILWVSEKDRGQADALNKGLNMATGDVIAYLNSDDYYLPGAFQTIVDHFNRSQHQWIIGDYCIVNQDGKPIHQLIRLYKLFLRSIPNLRLLFITNFIPQPSTFWKRDLMDKAGYFDESLRYAMDYDLFIRFWKLERPLIIKEKLSAFRIHQSSKGGKEFSKQFEEEYRVFRRYTNSLIFSILHTLHNQLIVLTYKVIK